jgi:hypothetical protein
MNTSETFMKKIEYLHIVCLRTSYIKVHTHEIRKYGIQKPVKTQTYNGMNFDKSQGTVGIEMYMNSVHLQLT